jgi:RNA polymerase sigma-70 factor (ECF subfamily)
VTDRKEQPVETSLSWLGRLAATGSDLDWQKLVEVYGPLLREWFAHTGVPTADRDDLAQEVMLAVFRGVADFERRGPGAFRAWLRGIVANQARKFFRDRKVHPCIDLDQLAGAGSALSRQWDREHDQHLAARALRAVEGDFAPQTWQAFRRQVLEHRSPAEVAAELGVSVNSVLLARSRVMKRLREELRGLIED